MISSAAIFTPFNWRATADDIAYVLDDAEAKLVAFDEAAATATLEAVETAGIGKRGLIDVGDGVAGTSFAALLSAEPVGGPIGAAADEICVMLYTSGTTGRPKGVPRSHCAERTAAASVIAHLRYRFGERSLGVMPLFHTMGIRVLLCSAMLNGAFVTMRGFDAGQALGLIAAEEITALFLVPTMLHDMLAHPEFEQTGRASIRNVACAGMAMTSALERRCAETLKPTIFANYYGSSEIFTFTFCDHLDKKPGCAGHAGINQIIRVVRADPDGAVGPEETLPAGEIGEVIGSMTSPIFANYYGSSEIFTFTFCDHLDKKPGCAGHAGINQIIRVVRADPDGAVGPEETLPAGEIGEVIGSMKSPEAFTGYWKRPDSDEKAIRDDWYFTGDLGFLDQDGALFLCGRIDDMIISGGENIHPEEVEGILAECPAVSQAAVVGLPDDRWGQKVVAFVEPAGEEATAETLDAHCRSSALARFKRPRAYVFVERLPTSASGKLLRRFLRDGDYRILTDYQSTL